ncbi:MAG: sensor domain-containing diguanylate cyclase, partial [Firmicutes bacterium]|nr:sensor domain-containing diguanylate cyclase [Bacillota bacterium]
MGKNIKRITKEPKFKNSIKFRLISIFIVCQMFLLAIPTVALTIFHHIQVETLTENKIIAVNDLIIRKKEKIDTYYTSKAVMASGLKASLFNGEQIDDWQEYEYIDGQRVFGITEEEYDRFMDLILGLLGAHDSIVSVYIMLFDQHRGTYILNANKDVGMGQTIYWHEKDWIDIDEINEIIYKANNGSTEPSIIETNNAEWGYTLTAYTPIRREDGTVAAHAAAGVDLSSVMAQHDALVEEKIATHDALIENAMLERQRVLTLALSIAAFVFFSSVTIAVFVVHFNVVKPIRILIKDLSKQNLANPNFKHRFSKRDCEFAFLERSIVTTETKAASAINSLKAEKELSGLMIESHPLGSFVVDLDLNILSCNKAAVNIFRLSCKREFLASFFDLMPQKQPCGHDSIKLIKDYFKRAETEDEVHFNWTHQLCNKTTIVTEMSLIKVRRDEKIRIVAYMRDVSGLEMMKGKIEELKTEVSKVNIDTLTGINNRRYFDERMAKVLKAGARSKSEFALMVIDIDNFKSYNDIYGHVGGDKALQRVATALKNVIHREEDFVVRYGGEEFCIVLPNTCKDGARDIAKKVVEAVEGEKIPHKGNGDIGYVTVSVGVGCGVADLKMQINDYVDCVDRYLYAAKAAGKNRFVF